MARSVRRLLTASPWDGAPKEVRLGDPATRLAQALARLSNCFCSSPAWYISFMMSQPPTNSPFM